MAMGEPCPAGRCQHLLGGLGESPGTQRCRQGRSLGSPCSTDGLGLAATGAASKQAARDGKGRWSRDPANAWGLSQR